MMKCISMGMLLLAAACGRESSARTSDAAPAVSAGVLESQRIAGEARIAPGDADVAAIRAAGKERVEAVARLCLDTAGVVQSVTLTKPSGFAGYDQTIEQGMRSWRFRPYEIDGKPTAVCTAVTFVYSTRPGAAAP